MLELFAVLWRLARIRASGAIDALLYSVGGPQLVPLVRDICLLPWILLASKKVIFHFHAGGIAETIDHHSSFLRSAVRFLYRQGEAAIVMTEFGRRDPACLGIHNIKVVPHTLEDTYRPDLVSRTIESSPILLYVGHFSHEKGTPALLQAFAALREAGENCSLQLVGECLPSYSEGEMKTLIRSLGLQSAVHLPGVLTGNEKWNCFAQASLFVFPSLAPESFGLATVEAMMWALPVVACDWRGNREILGEPLGGILFQPKPNLANALVDALREALALRSKWREWGAVNRRTFENNYKARTSRSPLLEVLEQLV
jgi:glycosyltransferase involved in cell wall biosynthesis